MSIIRSSLQYTQNSEKLLVTSDGFMKSNSPRFTVINEKNIDLILNSDTLKYSIVLNFSIIEKNSLDLYVDKIFKCLSVLINPIKIFMDNFILRSSESDKMIKILSDFGTLEVLFFYPDCYPYLKYEFLSILTSSKSKKVANFYKRFHNETEKNDSLDRVMSFQDPNSSFYYLLYEKYNSVIEKWCMKNIDLMEEIIPGDRESNLNHFKEKRREHILDVMDDLFDNYKFLFKQKLSIEDLIKIYMSKIETFYLQDKNIYSDDYFPSQTVIELYPFTSLLLVYHSLDKPDLRKLIESVDKSHFRNTYYKKTLLEPFFELFKEKKNLEKLILMVPPEIYADFFLNFSVEELKNVLEIIPDLLLIKTGYKHKPFFLVYEEEYLLFREDFDKYFENLKNDKIALLDIYLDKSKVKLEQKLVKLLKLGFDPSMISTEDYNNNESVCEEALISGNYFLPLKYLPGIIDGGYFSYLSWIFKKRPDYYSPNLFDEVKNLSVKINHVISLSYHFNHHLSDMIYFFENTNIENIKISYAFIYSIIILEPSLIDVLLANKIQPNYFSPNSTYQITSNIPRSVIVEKLLKLGFNISKDELKEIIINKTIKSPKIVLVQNSSELIQTYYLKYHEHYNFKSEEVIKFTKEQLKIATDYALN